jgi:hypothetical protein
MAAYLATSRIWTDGDVVERKVTDGRRRALANPTERHAGDALETRELSLQLADSLLEFVAALHHDLTLCVCTTCDQPDRHNSSAWSA